MCEQLYTTVISQTKLRSTDLSEESMRIKISLLFFLPSEAGENNMYLCSVYDYYALKVLFQFFACYGYFPFFHSFSWNMFWHQHFLSFYVLMLLFTNSVLISYWYILATIPNLFSHPQAFKRTWKDIFHSNNFLRTWIHKTEDFKNLMTF